MATFLIWRPQSRGHHLNNLTIQWQRFWQRCGVARLARHYAMGGCSAMNATPVQLPPKVEQSGSVRIITFTAGEFRDVENVIASELEYCLDASGGCHVLLDFTNVERISSVELGTLITLHKKMMGSGGRLTMFNMKAEIYEVFTVARLQTFMGICREDEALLNDKRTP
jgi:anti-anti-sigma factor